jgi:hypothetical protein
MPLIAKQGRYRRTRQLNVRVSKEIADALTDYCRFIDSCRNYVVEESLRYTFGHDRNFHEWRRTQGTTGERGARNEGREPDDVHA